MSYSRVREHVVSRALSSRLTWEQHVDICNFSFFWFSMKPSPVMFGISKSEIIMSVHVWFALHRHSGVICKGHIEGSENENTSYPRWTRISDKTLRITSLSSNRIILSLVPGFITFLSFLIVNSLSARGGSTTFYDFFISQKHEMTKTRKRRKNSYFPKDEKRGIFMIIHALHMSLL